MLSQRRRRWPSIKPALGQRLELAVRRHLQGVSSFSHPELGVLIPHVKQIQQNLSLMLFVPSIQPLCLSFTSAVLIVWLFGVGCSDQFICIETESVSNCRHFKQDIYNTKFRVGEWGLCPPPPICSFSSVFFLGGILTLITLKYLYKPKCFFWI